MRPLIRSTAPFLSVARRMGMAASLLVASMLPAAAQQPGTSPVKIYLMIGQSNMEGHGEISPVATPGTLQYIVANDPGNNYQFLVDGGGSWIVRDDVWIHYERLGATTPRIGGLQPGYGANGGNTTIGPELGFGHKIGNSIGNQVLLVKASWGGRSLGNDFLPPSSGPYPDPRGYGDAGYYYKETLRLVEDATSKLGSYFPNYNGQGYEIAGICWHQGYNDRVTPAYSAVYETNLANFIRDIRNDLGVPGLPFVIATTGMEGGTTYSQVEVAQMAMTNATTYPEFAGNVAVIDTRNTTYNGYAYWQPYPSSSPSDQGYHWNRNARTYLHIGLAMGDMMPTLTSPRDPSRLRASGGPTGVTLTWQNGTEMPSSVQVLRDGVEIAAAAPASPASFIDATSLPGVHNYQLVFTMPVNPSPPLNVSHNSGITGLNAFRSSGGVTLDWTNNLGYAAIEVRRNGVLIAPSVSGTATNYEDAAAPATGLVTYSVVPASGTSTPAQVQINLGPHTSPGALIYEPFDFAAGASLNSLTPSGFGLTGPWSRTSGASTNELQASNPGLGYGTLPVAGNRLRNSTTGGTRAARAVIGNTLTNAGLLSDGATLWFSVLVQPVTGANSTSGFGLASGDATYYNSAVNAVGINVQNGSDLEYWSDLGGTFSRTNAKTDLTLNIPHFVVGKLVWGSGGANDSFEIFMPDVNLSQGTRVGAIHSFNIDQSTLDRIVFYNQGGGIEFDEIRFGNTYNDVIGVGTDTSGDFTTPTPATMSFASPPAATSTSAITMTATTASDLNGVQYRFLETSGNPGGTSSDWQAGPTYTDTGLNANTQYTYTVQARDMSVNYNTNTVSAPALATTFAPDTNPPPTPGFASGPTATSSSAITMTSTAVTDPEGGGVEYYFTETSGNPGSTSSGWQSSPIYTDTGLSASTLYTYTVKARDTASPPNESAASSAQSATTLAAGGPGGSLIYEPFDMSAGTLNGQAAGFGLSGNWTRYAGSSTSDFTVQSPGATYGTLSTTGNTIGVTGSSNRRYRASTGTTLSAAGLLADGAELWFSLLITPRTEANSRAQFMLANGDITTDQGVIGTTGDGIGINLQNGSDLRTVTCDGGVTANTTIQDNLTLNVTRLVVAKIVWGSGGANDTMYIYRPGTNLLLPASPEKTVTADLAQTTFDRLTVASLNNATDWDEIRFGASYAAVIGTIQPPYDAWSGGAAFDVDTNGDGVKNGLAFLLGAAGPNVNAISLLPVVTQTSSNLTLTFKCLNAASRGNASLSVEHSSNLGISDPWTAVAVPDANSGPTSGVTFTVSPGSPLNNVQATISSGEAASGKLFGRLKVTGP